MRKVKVKNSKTQEKIQKQYDQHRSYKLMSAQTGIDSKRLGQIRAGKGDKASRSEISRISRFKVIENIKKVGQEVTFDDIKRSTGVSKDEIRKIATGGEGGLKITKKYLEEDGSYLLKTKDNSNYLLYMRIYVNLQNGVVEVGLNKRFIFKVLGDTGTRYEEHEVNGKRYSFTITVFRLHQYSNLKSTVDKQIKKILSAGDGEIETNEIDTLLSLTGYV